VSQCFLRQTFAVDLSATPLILASLARGPPQLVWVNTARGRADLGSSFPMALGFWLLVRLSKEA
jgi:hypothetical protein